MFRLCMNIIKALIYTALLIGLEIVVSLGVYGFIDIKLADTVSLDGLTHYFGIATFLPRIIAYLAVFYFFTKVNFDWEEGVNSAKMINGRIMCYLLIIAVGLELLDRPLFDFCHIFDYVIGLEIEPYEFSERSTLSVVYSGIAALIIAPIFEELFFRKYLFSELVKSYSLKISIVISSLCFSLIHIQSLRNLLPTFIFGIVSCIIYKITKNISYSIILHFFVNLSWLLLTFYGSLYYEWSYDLEYNLTYWLLSIFGIGLLYVGVKRIIATSHR